MYLWYPDILNFSPLMTIDIIKIIVKLYHTVSKFSYVKISAAFVIIALKRIWTVDLLFTIDRQNLQWCQKSGLDLCSEYRILSNLYSTDNLRTQWKWYKTANHLYKMGWSRFSVHVCNESWITVTQRYFIVKRQFICNALTVN